MIEEGLCPCGDGQLSPPMPGSSWRCCGTCGCLWKLDEGGRCATSPMGIHRKLEVGI